MGAGCGTVANTSTVAGILHVDPSHALMVCYYGCGMWDCCQYFVWTHHIVEGVMRV